jgi:hypothetical protein
MEQWSDGIMGNENTEYWKSGTSEEWFFRKEELPNVPLFQYSSIPLVFKEVSGVLSSCSDP